MAISNVKPRQDDTAEISYVFTDTQGTVTPVTGTWRLLKRDLTEVTSGTVVNNTSVFLTNTDLSIGSDGDTYRIFAVDVSYIGDGGRILFIRDELSFYIDDTKARANT